MKYLFIGILLLFASSAECQNKSILSPDSLYNLGNAAFNQDQFDQAIYYYEKARLLDPWGTDIRINLKLANEKLSTDIIELEPFFLASWWNSMTNLMLPGSWKVVSILLLGCLIALVYFYFFKGKPKKKSLFYSVFCLLLLLFLVSIFSGKTRFNQIFNSPYAIVFGEDQSLLIGPDNVSEEAKRITGGNKLKILDEDGEWYKVSTIDSEQGWIKKINVKLIKF